MITYTDVGRRMVQDTLLDGTEPVRIERYIPSGTNKAIGTSNIVTFQVLLTTRQGLSRSTERETQRNDSLLGSLVRCVTPQYCPSSMLFIRLITTSIVQNGRCSEYDNCLLY